MGGRGEVRGGGRGGGGGAALFSLASLLISVASISRLVGAHAREGL